MMGRSLVVRRVHDWDIVVRTMKYEGSQDQSEDM